MIPGREKDRLFLADTLAWKHPVFLAAFKRTLASVGVPVSFLPGTRDIWAVDYMPIQVGTDRFVEFTYDPDYLRPKRWHHTRSDGCAIARQLGLMPIESSIRVDGGNVVCSREKVIMCDKIFRENRELPAPALLRTLSDLFETDRVIVVPSDPADFTGHADGAVRFLDDDTVLINAGRGRDGYQSCLD